MNLVPSQISNLLNALFIAPTPLDPKLGVCNDCNPDRKVFLNELMNFENPDSCFMLNHDVEPLAGVPWQQTEAYKDAFIKELYYETLEKQNRNQLSTSNKGGI